MNKNPLTCPGCGKRMTLDVATTTVKCRHCGFVPMLHDNASRSHSRHERAHQPVPTMITYRGKLEPRVEGMFLSGHGALKQGKTDEALRYFRSAIDYQPDFVDAHLWIARLIDDPVKKRDHLETVLAYDPNHIDALREIMVIDGRITQGQADRTHHFDDIETRTAEGVVQMQTKALVCEICHGHMDFNERTRIHECRFCGHKVELKQAESIESLSAALLERKSQAVKWVIGERLLHCNECGAERTIPGRKLSQMCPFCGSTHVMVEDALNSFQQPDGLIPFKVTREQASTIIQNKLKSAAERLKNMFDRNDLQRAQLDGVYLPYWLFDGAVEVTRSTIDRRTHRRDVQSYRSESFSDGVYNIPVCGVSSPAPILTEKLGAFDWGKMVGYDPRLLAKYPAELYSIDFDRASLQSHQAVSRMMKERYDRPDGDEVESHVFTAVKQMTFQLVLVPVWVATLLERDGDVRQALVNGQTGVAVLGKPQKRSN